MPDFTPEQQRLEELAERCLAEAENAMETNEGFLFAAISGAKDYADAQVRLLECWPKLSSDVLADLLHRGLVAAECWGRLTVENEAAEARRGASRSAPTTRSAKTADFAAADPTEIRLEPLVMKEALEFWAAKTRMPASEFYALDDRAKTLAFAVSGIAKGDELEQVYQALTRAIEKGTTLADFKRECAAIFEKRGWVGKRAWRVDNIFRTNLQTAYNVGRYKQQKEQAKFFPYLRYSAVNDSRTRPTHRALDGLIYPIDHEFWDHWYPPNGFRCRCGTRALTKGQVDRGGLKVETKDPTGSLIEPVAANGERMPAVQLLPDKGFDYHPGKEVWDPVVAAMDACSAVSVLYEAGKDTEARKAGEKALTRLIRALGILHPDYAFVGVEIFSNKRDDWAAGIDPPKRDTRGGKMYLNDAECVWEDVWDEHGKTTTLRWRPGVDLFRALQKTRNHVPLTFIEENLLADLQHEAQHTWEKRSKPVADHSEESVYLELVNEWRTRRIYPALVKRLGGKAVWAEEIKKYGHGYSHEVANFDALLKRMGIADDAKLLDKMNEMHLNEDVHSFKDGLIRLLTQMKDKNMQPLPTPLSELLKNIGKKPEEFRELLDGKRGKP